MTQILFTFILSFLLVQKNTDSFHLLKSTLSFLPKSTYFFKKLDIRTLSNNEYKNIFEGEDSELYLMTDNADRKLYFEEKPLQAVLTSPSGNQTVFAYKFDGSSGEGLAISLVDFDGKTRDVKHPFF